MRKAQSKINSKEIAQKRLTQTKRKEKRKRKKLKRKSLLYCTSSILPLGSKNMENLMFIYWWRIDGYPHTKPC